MHSLSLAPQYVFHPLNTWVFEDKNYEDLLVLTLKEGKIMDIKDVLALMRLKVRVLECIWVANPEAASWSHETQLRCALLALPAGEVQWEIKRLIEEIRHHAETRSPREALNYIAGICSK